MAAGITGFCNHLYHSCDSFTTGAAEFAFAAETQTGSHIAVGFRSGHTCVLL
jgi:hypothetical protein